MASTFQKIFSMLRINNGLSSIYTNDTLEPACMDDRGAVFSQNIINGSAANFMLSDTNDSDNHASTPLVVADPALTATTNYLYGYDSVGDNWDRVRTGGNSADGVASETLGILKQAASLYGFNGATFDRLLTQANNGDDVAVSTLGLLKQAAFGYQFNGTTFERTRGNTDEIWLPSAVRSTTTNSADFINYNGRGLWVVFEITAVPGVTSVTCNIQRKHPNDGSYSIVLGGAPQTGVTTIQMRLYPGIAVAAAITNSDVLSRVYRIQVVHSGAGDFTYSVAGSVLI